MHQRRRASGQSSVDLCICCCEPQVYEIRFFIMNRHCRWRMIYAEQAMILYQPTDGWCSVSIVAGLTRNHAFFMGRYAYAAFNVTLFV